MASTARFNWFFQTCGLSSRTSRSIRNDRQPRRSLLIPSSHFFCDLCDKNNVKLWLFSPSPSLSLHHQPTERSLVRSGMPHSTTRTINVLPRRRDARRTAKSVGADPPRNSLVLGKAVGMTAGRAVGATKGGERRLSLGLGVFLSLAAVRSQPSCIHATLRDPQALVG